MSEINMRVIGPHQFDLGTAQTSGSERHAAIAPEFGMISAIWGSIFEIAPGARTGVHHHGKCRRGRLDRFELRPFVLTRRIRRGVSLIVAALPVLFVCNVAVAQVGVVGATSPLGGELG